VDLAALEQLLVRFSQLVASSRGSRKLTSTRCSPPPTIWSRSTPASSCTTQDAEDKLPKLAIRPYPTQYVAPWK
jgi:acetyltransferase